MHITPVQQRVIDAVIRERDRQEQKKAAGDFTHTCADPELPVGDKLAILTEENGEVAKAVLQILGTGAISDAKQDLRKELIQVAAVAVAWVESLDYQ